MHRDIHKARLQATPGAAFRAPVARHGISGSKAQSLEKLRIVEAWPGQPFNRRTTRETSGLALLILMANVNLYDLIERNDDLRNIPDGLELEVHFLAGDAADSFADVFVLLGFD